MSLKDFLPFAGMNDGNTLHRTVSLFWGGGDVMQESVSGVVGIIKTFVPSFVNPTKIV
jgi:hypothetical protein